MRTEITNSNAFSSQLNSWIYDENMQGISCSNIDCVISKFAMSGDSIYFVEFKKPNEQDRPMAEIMLKKLADGLKIANKYSGQKFGVFKIRGKPPFNSIERYDYMTGESVIMDQQELKEWIGEDKHNPDFDIE